MKDTSTKQITFKRNYFYMKKIIKKTVMNITVTLMNNVIGLTVADVILQYEENN